MKAKTRAAIFALPSASTRIRSPKSTFFPTSTRSNYALMFVPSESIYYELLMTEDTKHGRLDEYCREKRVLPVSPNTFFAILSAVAISLQGQKIEENAKHLLANLAGVIKADRSLRGSIRKARHASPQRAEKLRGCRQQIEPRAQFPRTDGAGRAARFGAQGTRERHDRVDRRRARFDQPAVH